LIVIGDEVASKTVDSPRVLPDVPLIVVSPKELKPM
jgi:hypothetical protein